MSEQVHSVIASEAEWVELASCRHLYDLNVMFPDQDDYRGVAVAKFVCSGCVVKVECLESALDRAEPHGVWGGQTEKERQKVLRRRAKEVGGRALT